MKEKTSELENCTADWGIAFSGSRKWTPLLPDMNATYWYYAFNLPAKNLPSGGTTGIRFKGQFGHARYQGINVYDDDTGDLVWGSENLEHKSSLRDVDTEPDEVSENPFQPGVNRNTPHRDYTISLVREGTNTSGYSNVITFPPAETGVEERHFSVYLRVYLPDKRGQKPEEVPYHLSGGVPLPTIEAFDTASGDVVDCPGTRPFPGGGVLPPGPGQNSDGQVFFYRVTAKDYYPNQDNAYLVTVFKEIADTVAVLRVKPPTFTDTRNPRMITPEPREVRYWSFNVYSTKLTNVSACVADYQATVAKDGFVYLVLGRRTPEILKQAEGLNFLPWGVHNEILLVFRHLLPNQDPVFEGSAAAVPVFDPALVDCNDPHSREKQSGDKFIGDYAPRGIYCAEADFLKDFGGFDVEYE